MDLETQANVGKLFDRRVTEDTIKEFRSAEFQIKQAVKDTSPKEERCKQ